MSEQTRRLLLAPTIATTVLALAAACAPRQDIHVVRLADSRGLSYTERTSAGLPMRVLEVTDDDGIFLFNGNRVTEVDLYDLDMDGMPDRVVEKSPGFMTRYSTPPPASHVGKLARIWLRHMRNGK